MPQSNIVTMTPRRAARTQYASVADTFSTEELIAEIGESAINGSGDYALQIDTYVTARGRRAA